MTLSPPPPVSTHQYLNWYLGRSPPSSECARPPPRQRWLFRQPLPPPPPPAPSSPWPASRSPCRRLIARGRLRPVRSAAARSSCWRQLRRRGGGAWAESAGGAVTSPLPKNRPAGICGGRNAPRGGESCGGTPAQSPAPSPRACLLSGAERGTPMRRGAADGRGGPLRVRLRRQMGRGHQGHSVPTHKSESRFCSHATRCAPLGGGPQQGTLSISPQRMYLFSFAPKTDPPPPARALSLFSGQRESKGGGRPSQLLALPGRQRSRLKGPPAAAPSRQWSAWQS